MLNDTLKKFGFPESLIKTYGHWHLLLRPDQTTLASLILICKDEVESYSTISPEAADEQKLVVKDIETVLRERFDYVKINYLMLMMVDPEVHFHIIPRYDKERNFANQMFDDMHWPKPPDLSKSIELSDAQRALLLSDLKADFAKLSVKAGSEKKYGRMYTSGCFDIFHHGHLNILKRSKALCDYLVVGVSTDELILKEKGRLPVIPYEERVSVLESISLVDEVIPQVDKNKQNIVDQYHIDAISVGDDWKGRYPSVTCEMEYFQYTPSISSTILKDKLNLLKDT